MCLERACVSPHAADCIAGGLMVRHEHASALQIRLVRWLLPMDVEEGPQPPAPVSCSCWTKSALHSALSDAGSRGLVGGVLGLSGAGAGALPHSAGWEERGACGAPSLHVWQRSPCWAPQPPACQGSPCCGSAALAAADQGAGRPGFHGCTAGLAILLDCWLADALRCCRQRACMTQRAAAGPEVPLWCRSCSVGLGSSWECTLAGPPKSREHCLAALASAGCSSSWHMQVLLPVLALRIAALSGTCLTSWPSLQCASCWLLWQPVGVQYAYHISCTHQLACMLPADCPCMPVTTLTQ